MRYGERGKKREREPERQTNKNMEHSGMWLIFSVANFSAANVIHFETYIEHNKVEVDMGQRSR